MFLAESVKGGIDLVADIKFKKCVFYRLHFRYSNMSLPSRDDVITLQDPHGLPPMHVSKTADKVTEKEKTKVVAKSAATGQATTKAKNVPCKLVNV